MLEHPGEDLNDRKKKERLQLLNPDGQHTFEDAAEGYLQFLKQQGRREGTIKEYRNMLWNQVLPVLGPSTPLKDLNWSVGGRPAPLHHLRRNYWTTMMNFKIFRLNERYLREMIQKNLKHGDMESLVNEAAELFYQQEKKRRLK